MAKVYIKTKHSNFLSIWNLKKAKTIIHKKLRTGKCQFDECVGAEEVKILNMKANKRKWEKKKLQTLTQILGTTK